MERLTLVLVANKQLIINSLRIPQHLSPCAWVALGARHCAQEKKQNLKEPNSALLNLKSGQGEKLNWGKMLLFGKSPRGV